MERMEYIEGIKQHILSAKIKNIYSVDMVSKAKTEKTLVFPSFEQVFDYVNNANNSEKFILRIQETLKKHKEYISSDEKMYHKVSLEPLKKRCEISQNTINKLLKIVNLNVTFEELEDFNIEKKVTLVFEENFSDSLLFLNELLMSLSAKIKKHLIANSIYGKGYVIKYEEDIKQFKEKDTVITLTKVNDSIKKILDKKYFVDFLSDGIEELQEMLKAFWYGMSALLFLTKPTENVEYFVDSNMVENIKKWLKEKVDHTYYLLDEFLFNDEIFTSLTDIQVRDIYDKIIKVKIPKEVNPRSESDVASKKCKAEKKLEELIGLDSVKEMIEKIKAYTISNKGKSNLNLHMAFYGNPGTGKTEVAKLIGEILYEHGVLPKKSYVEATRSDLVGPFIGWTAMQTNALIDKAMGGVLFIDEAYSLAIEGDKKDFGHEAVAELIKAMEDKKGKFCVILAGYKNPMQKMLATNPGFNSRIQFHVDFPNYSRDELSEIFQLLIDKDGYIVNEDALEKMLDITDILRKNPDFANARDVRNIIQQCTMNLSLRTCDPNNRTITIEDVNKYIKDNKIGLTSSTEASTKILTADEELESLIGLSNVKTNIKKIRAYAKKNKNSLMNLHMAFSGNPGTGKTEVANIISRILYEAGVLSEAKVIVANREKLVAGYIGQTAEKTKKVIDSAMGGVLFIDEAYSLTPTSPNDFGAEAIATLIEEMENNKGKFAVILAGYEQPLKQMISTNPGFSSRIQFWINFPDYTKDELRNIAEIFIKKSGNNYEIEDKALDLIIEVVEVYRNDNDFANARTVRKIIQDVILNQNVRTEDELNNNLILLEDVIQYINDNNISINIKNNSSIDENIINDLKIGSITFDSTKCDINYYEQSVISISDQNSQGTGFIVTPNGLAFTCAHCIHEDSLNQRARITLCLADGQKFYNYVGFEILFIDKVNDFAIIKLDYMGMNYKYIPLSLEKNVNIEPLKDFLMVGYPFGGETFTSVSITKGIVASVNYYNNRLVAFADMFGKAGSSGSPIIDPVSNKVIGIFFGGITNSSSNEEINCFTPIDEVWKTLV